jgi:cell division protein FtsQ
LLAAVMAIAASGLRAGGPGLTPLDRLLALAGFSLNQVSLTGQRFTSDDDIYEALDLAHARTVPLFDCRAAQRRIEQLPFIAAASVARVLPDRLEIEVRERTPAAVWQRGEASVLIDATGRVLAAVADNAAVDLPRVTGDGAAAATGELLLLLSHHPALRGELALAERVGERRWTLWLAGGGSILLPAADADAALDTAAIIADALAGRSLRIDLRAASRALVSDAPPRAAGNGGTHHDPADNAADIGSARLGEAARGQTGGGA